MTIRRKRELLWTTAAIAAGVAVIVVALAATTALDLPDSGAAAAGSTIAPAGVQIGSADDIPSIDDLATVWSIDLGHDVVATGPAPTADAASAPPPPDLHVIGTIIEPGHSLAMLIGPAGKTLFIGVGEQFQGATIVAINNDSVTVEIAGARSVLKVEKPPASESPAKPAVITTPEDQ
jgi:hypothetical protein